MTGGASPLLGYQFFDDDGAVVANGSVYTVLAGTNTPVATFADADLTTPNTNPVALDASGRVVMFFDPTAGGTEGVRYDVYVSDANAVLVATFEDVAPPVPPDTAFLSNVLLGFGDPTTLTVNGGTIVPTGNAHLCTPEGGAADNLDTIDPSNLPDGALLILGNTSGSATLTLRHGVGNIYTGNGSNVTLLTTSQRVALLRLGANFYQVGDTNLPDWFDQSVKTSATPTFAGVKVNTGGLRVGSTAAPDSSVTVLGGALASADTGGIGWNLASALTTGRVLTTGAAGIGAMHTFSDAAAMELSAGATSGYVSAVTVAARSSSVASGADAIGFWTRSVLRMLVTGSGSPATVSVTGTIQASSTITAGGSGFIGAGAGLTGLKADELTSGTLADARLSANVPLYAASELNLGANDLLVGSTALFVDASAKMVGIGTDTPANELSVVGVVGATSNFACQGSDGIDKVATVGAETWTFKGGILVSAV